MKTTTHDVVVHKAGLTLMKGESLGKFTRELNESAKKFLFQKLNIDSATMKAGAYMVEVFSDSVIFDVWKQKGENVPHEYRYFAMKYSRKSTGEFEFSYTTEVERVTTFQPKEGTAVTKEAPKPPTLAPAPAEATVAKAMPLTAPGWSATSKSFWDGAAL